MHPDPGFAFNPANNVVGRVPQPKKQEQKKPEVNTQPQESVGKPAELVQSQEISPKYEKNIQKPVTAPEKKRYNNMGVSKSTVKPNAPRSPEPLIPEVQNGTIIPTPDGKFLAVHGPMVKTTKTREDAVKAILDAGGKVQEDETDKANNEIEKNVLHGLITRGKLTTIDEQTRREERKKVVDEFIDLSKKTGIKKRHKSWQRNYFWIQ